MVQNEMISAQIPAELTDGLRRLASERERSDSGELRLAVREHLDRAQDSSVSASTSKASPPMTAEGGS